MVRYLGWSRRGRTELHRQEVRPSDSFAIGAGEHAGIQHRPNRYRLNRSLAKNSIYAIDLGDTHVSCKVKVRSPQPPLTDASLASYGQRLVAAW